MKYVLGIDQGASKTHALIATLDGTIVATGLAPGACHTFDGMNTAMVQVKAAVSQVLDTAGITMNQIEALGAGMTGADFQEEYLLLHQALTALFPKIPHIRVVNDCMVALWAEAAAPNAAIICAGSGLNCGARSADGREVVLGYYIADHWQGGGGLARQALTSVFEAHLGLRPATLLTQGALSHFRQPDVDTLLRNVIQQHIPANSIKHFMPVLDDCACQGDPEAIMLLRRFGVKCARYAVSCARQLALPEQSLEVVLSGSIFKCRSAALRQGVKETLTATIPGAKLCDAVYEPVVGALFLALSLLHAPPADHRDRLGPLAAGLLRQTD